MHAPGFDNTPMTTQKILKRMEEHKKAIIFEQRMHTVAICAALVVSFAMLWITSWVT